MNNLLKATQHGGNMTLDNNTNTNQNDKIMAALAHISVLLPLIGLLAPIVIWVTQKEKSKYVAFQSLQAIAYQLVMIFAYFIAMGCYMLSFFTTFFSIPFMGGNPDPSAGPFLMAGFLIPFLVFGFIFIGGGLFILYGIIAAVFTIQGKDFKYILIGNQIEKFLEKENN
jgi:uncharacterized Tic20 family protein